MDFVWSSVRSEIPVHALVWCQVGSQRSRRLFRSYWCALASVCFIVVWYMCTHIRRCLMTQDAQCQLPFSVKTWWTQQHFDAHWAINNLLFFHTIKNLSIIDFGISFFVRVCPLNAVPEKNRRCQLSVRKLRSHQLAVQSSGWIHIEWINL